MNHETTPKAYIGTSGWSYRGWKNNFYKGIPAKNRLAYCAQRFTGIEVNATFYGLQKKATFEKWRDQTPGTFRFSIKANRFLTHNKKLKAPADSIGLERERASGLGEKLAAVVWQLPPRLEKDMQRLTGFAAALKYWPEPRHVLEFRHASWFDTEVAECLRRHRLAVCISDAADWPLWDMVTTDLVYVRLHGHDRTYVSSYDEGRLAQWAGRASEWLRKGCEVHIYFDNDAEGRAAYEAMRLLNLVHPNPSRGD